jgi:glycosyltransferase involved in cell wall biosynthesis
MTLVSVIVPVHNRRTLIGATLRSVLAQTYPDVELLVVDDGSDDGTPDEVASSFGDAVRLIRLGANRGRSAARNIGWAEARGDLVAFLDSDDLWAADKLARQVPCFANGDVSLVQCRIAVVDASGESLVTESAQLARAFDDADARGYEYGGVTETWCRMYTSTVVIRRRALEATGGFDERLAQFEDWDLFWRVARQGRVVALPETLVQYRRHAGNTPLRWAQDAEPWLYVMHKHLAALRPTDTEPTLRRARHNLLLNIALGEYWRGDRRASRRWMLRALRVDPRPLYRPVHPVWSAPLFNAFLPAIASDFLVRVSGVDAYVVDRAPSHEPAA